MLNSRQCRPNVQRVIADIGGTNARFAVLNNDGTMQDQIVLKGADHTDFISAFNQYLRLISNPSICEAAIAIANTIDGDNIKMTNHDWDFSIRNAQESLGLDTLIFKNDFEALAMSIPYLKPDDFYKVCGGEFKKKKPIGVLGPGTGFGVSGLIYSGEHWVPISGEGGHVSLSPTTKREIEVFETCLTMYNHVSAERLISGPGLILIYKIICQLDRVEAIPEVTPQIISQNALSKTDKQCVETLDVFLGFLGVIAGNLALTLGAQGGIYIGGGIVPKLDEYIHESPFRERFIAKGRFKEYLKKIPVFVIQAKYPALTGISQLFNN